MITPNIKNMKHDLIDRFIIIPIVRIFVFLILYRNGSEEPSEKQDFAAEINSSSVSSRLNALHLQSRGIVAGGLDGGAAGNLVHYSVPRDGSKGSQGTKDIGHRVG